MAGASEHPRGKAGERQTVGKSREQGERDFGNFMRNVKDPHTFIKAPNLRQMFDESKHPMDPTRKHRPQPKRHPMDPKR